MNPLSQMLQSVVSTTPPAWAGATELFLTLHTTMPNEFDQASNELLYTGHQRVGILRTDMELVWRATDTGVENRIELEMPEVVDGDGRYEFWSLGLTRNGPGQIVLLGSMLPPRRIVPGVIPVFKPGRLFIDLVQRGN